MAENGIKEKALITPKEVSQQFPYSAGTLANWRHNKKGPPYYKRGVKVLYDAREFERWCRANLVRTAE